MAFFGGEHPELSPWNQSLSGIHFWVFTGWERH